MSKQLCATLWQGFDKVIEARAALQELFERSDQDGLRRTNVIASAIKAFQKHTTDYETLLNNSVTLPDGKPIYATDYLALCKLAADNRINTEKIFKRIYYSSTNATRRILDINLSELRLVNISALKHLTAVSALSLSDNEIVDISPIQHLTNLGWLNISKNQIVDLSPIQRLKALTFLSLNKNQIVNITPIQNLTALTDLYLGENRIVDISPVQNLTKLERLALDDNQIVDLSPILNLRNLEFFSAENNPLSEASEAILAARSQT